MLYQLAGALGIATALAIAPSLALNATRVLGESLVWLEQLALLALVLLPVAYFYILMYRQPGSMEVRVNQAISGFSYATIIVLLGTIVVSLANLLVNMAEIIGAQLDIESAPEYGTTKLISWKKSPLNK